MVVVKATCNWTASVPFRGREGHQKIGEEREDHTKSWLDFVLICDALRGRLCRPIHPGPARTCLGRWPSHENASSLWQATVVLPSSAFREPVNISPEWRHQRHVLQTRAANRGWILAGLLLHSSALAPATAIHGAESEGIVAFPGPRFWSQLAQSYRLIGLGW